MIPQSTGALLASMVAPGQQPMPNFQSPELQTLPPGISGLVQDPLGQNGNPFSSQGTSFGGEQLTGYNIGTMGRGKIRQTR